ncbi:hypothetical protein FQA39_LY14984 [Lamprigera yunnana]|nr:hypothetical protein FQA39_LY14984 [Lamprigera yunnana]
MFKMEKSRSLDNRQPMTNSQILQTPNFIQGQPAVNMEMSQLSSAQPIHQSVPQMYLSQTVSQTMSSNSNYYIPPNQEQFLNNQKTTHTPQEVQNSPKYLGMSFTSDDEMDSFTPQDHPWQVVKGVKRRKNSTNKEAATANLTL